MLSKKFKFMLIHIGGTMISMISLLWMPWRLRIMWAKFIYKVTYVNPAKHPTFMQFMESANVKFQMGKRTEGMYEQIDSVRRHYEASAE